MTFSVSSSRLLSRLQNLNKAVPTKNPAMSILEKFLFEIDEDVLTLTASDNDVTLRTQLNIKNIDNVSVCMAIQAQILLGFLRNSPDQDIIFDVDPESLRVQLKSQSGVFDLISEDGRGYPQIISLKEGDEGVCTVKVQQNRISSGIGKSLFATAVEDSRPVMTGVNCIFEERGMAFEATDAHKMVRILNTAKSFEGRNSFILPRKSASMLKGLLGTEEIEVAISFDKKRVVFELPEYLMICRQIEGTYPNLEMIVPKNNDKEILVDRESLLNAVRRVQTFSDRTSLQIKLQIAENQIKINAQDINWRISGSEALACSYAGSPITIAFKAPQLTDILNEIPDSAVIIKLSEPSRAGLILPQTNAADEEMVSLIMPLLLND